MKELRVMLPVWFAALVTMVAGFLSSEPRILIAGLLAYGIGSIALGALSVGHEYRYRTVGVLLTQPIARQRMLLVKLGVLTPLLLILAAAAWYAPFNTEELQRLSGWHHHGVVLLPLVVGLFIAPWLTMACRRALAGVVFAGSLPGTLMVCGNLAGIAWFGMGDPDVEPFRARAWLGGMVIMSVVSAFMGWRSFMGLEAIEGAGAEVRMPEWFRVPSRPPARHPVWLLIRKELHLQQMTFVIVLLFAIGWSALSLLKDTVPAFADAPLVPVTIIYLVLLSIVIGSLASAEERGLGVLQWQVLLPVPAWRQWAAKAGVVFGLGLLMGVGLPALLNYASPAPDFDVRALWRENTRIVVVLTAFSLYVSSLSTSGLRAMIAAFPIAVAGLVLVQWLLSTLLLDSNTLVSDAYARAMNNEYRLERQLTSSGLSTMLVALALALAFENHRSAERGFRRVGIQILGFVAIPLGAVFVYAVTIAIKMMAGGYFSGRLQMPNG